MRLSLVRRRDQFLRARASAHSPCSLRLPLDGVSVSMSASAARAVPAVEPAHSAGRSTKSANSPDWAQPLLSQLPEPTGCLSFVTDGVGVVGWGSWATLRMTGRDAARQIEAWFAVQVEVIRGIDATADPICFVSLGFAPSDESVAVIPAVAVTRDEFSTRVTGPGRPISTTPLVAHGDEPRPSLRTPPGSLPGSLTMPTPMPIAAPGQVSYADSDLSATEFMTAVAQVVARIRAGEAEKVVLAHGLTAFTEFPVDERFLLQHLAERYPSCSVFAVDGLLGASPEMLIRRRGRSITSRVLAGTAWPDRAHDAAGSTQADPPLSAGSAEPASTHDVAIDLLASAKDLEEHMFAVRSVAEVLGPLTAHLDVPDGPSTLELANLTHLATDISGTLNATDPAPSALALAAALHPTAAVGGTPTDVATALIAELEPAPRGRYAAPVGWINARGDGDFAIALRCALVESTSVTMVSGCGIVADSDPASEAREAQVKMLPIRDALEG